MKHSLPVIIHTIALITMLALSSCKSSSSAPGASSSTPSSAKTTARLAFSNSDQQLQSMRGISQQLLTLQSGQAAQFEMKLIAVYLAEDIDPVTWSNVGRTSMFYVNPDCEGDLSHCDLSEGPSEDSIPITKIISDYFDFSSPQQATDALNPEDLEIEEGQYKYVRLEFCKYNAGNAPNIRWGSDNLVDVEFQANHCTVNSVVMDPPLVVEEGDSLTVTLGYSLENTLTYGEAASGTNCVGEGEDRVCFSLPDFRPTASK